MWTGGDVDSPTALARRQVYSPPESLAAMDTRVRSWASSTSLPSWYLGGYQSQRMTLLRCFRRVLWGQIQTHVEVPLLFWTLLVSKVRWVSWSLTRWPGWCWGGLAVWYCTGSILSINHACAARWDESADHLPDDLGDVGWVGRVQAGYKELCPLHHWPIHYVSSYNWGIWNKTKNTFLGAAKQAQIWVM